MLGFLNAQFQNLVCYSAGHQSSVVLVPSIGKGIRDKAYDRSTVKARAITLCALSSSIRNSCISTLGKGHRISLEVLRRFLEDDNFLLRISNACWSCTNGLLGDKRERHSFGHSASSCLSSLRDRRDWRRPDRLLSSSINLRASFGLSLTSFKRETVEDDSENIEAMWADTLNGSITSLPKFFL